VGCWRQTLIGYRSHPHPGPSHKGEGKQRYTFMSQIPKDEGYGRAEPFMSHLTGAAQVRTEPAARYSTRMR
jgi:hypothetical protein